MNGTMTSLFQRPASAFATSVILLFAISQTNNVNAFMMPSKSLRVIPVDISPCCSKSRYPKRVTLQMGLRSTFSHMRQSNIKKGMATNDSNQLFQRGFRLSRLIQRFRRSVTLLFAAALMFFGPSIVSPQNTPVAHASSTVVSKSQKAQQQLDKIIHKYVKENMFNDDKFDPFESAYRETISDSNTGEYPSLLSNTASSALGRKGLTAPTSGAASGKTDYEAEGKIIKAVMKTVDALHLKTGISKSVLNLVLVGVGVGGSVIGLCLGLMGFSNSQKAMTEKMAVERYGESVLSAQEVIVDDDDDDYETGDFDDDDDDDDVSICNGTF